MKKVYGNFVFEWLPDGINMRLVTDLVFNTKDFGKIKVPANEITDGSSIPRFLWVVAKSPFVGKHKFAAVLHDYLYRVGRWTANPIVSRADADKLFYEFMRIAGVGKLEAKTKYWAVRLFGPRW